MNERHQTSRLTKHNRGGWTHTLRYNFFVRVAWIVVALMGLMVVTMGTYHETENLIDFLTQWFTRWNT